MVEALAAAGVPSIVIKGPGIAQLLYDDGAPRPYGDSDLLVPGAKLEEAKSVLRGLGFEPGVDAADVPSGVSFRHASPWGRKPKDFLDLHWSLSGCRAEAAAVWRALAAETRPAQIGGARAEIPNRPATALIAALHLASHGTGASKATNDLERAVERFSLADWKRAAELAAELDATEPFAAGLRMSRAGKPLADELSLPHASSVRLAIAAGGGPGTAHGIEVLARTPGMRGRVRLLARTIVPSRRYMKIWFPRAARGRAWLALAYLYRPVWLGRRSVPSIVAWTRARREVRSLRAGDGS